MIEKIRKYKVNMIKNFTSAELILLCLVLPGALWLLGLMLGFDLVIYFIKIAILMGIYVGVWSIPYFYEHYTLKKE